MAEITLSDLRKPIRHMSNVESLNKSINCILYQSAKLLNAMIMECCVSHLSTHSEQQSQAAESFLRICTEFIENKPFLRYYERHFGLSQQIKLLNQPGLNRM